MIFLLSLSLFQARTMIFIVSNLNNDYFLSLFRFGAIIFFYSLFRFGMIIFFIIVLLGTIVSSRMMDFSFPIDIFFIIILDGSRIFFYNHHSGMMIFYCSETMIFLSLFLWEQ